MDRLEAMSIYLAVIDAGSFAAAARHLGCSRASVTRAVARLEENSGERLLERTTRQFTITEAGARHADVYRQLMTELAKLEAHAQHSVVSGTVVVTAPELFGRLNVMPVVESFLAANPCIEIRSLLVNRMVDLVGEGIDVAVRLAPLSDSSLTAVKLGEVRRLTCAAPSYLNEHGIPQKPSDLSDHWCIGLNDAGPQELWGYREHPSGRRVKSVRVGCRLTTNSAGAAIDAAVRGLGIIRPLSYQVGELIAQGSLVPLLHPYEPDTVPVSLVFLAQRRDNYSAAWMFIDHAVPRLRERLKILTSIVSRSVPEGA